MVLKPDYADAHNNLGNLLELQGNTDDAIAHYARAVALNPNHAEAHNNLGNIFRQRGEFDQALEHYDRAIRIAPANAEIHFHRAEIKTFHAGDADLAALEAMARGDDLPAKKAPYVHFAAAKALEDIGDYAQAFEHLRKGNTLKRRQIHYNEKSVAKLFERTCAAFDRGLFDRH